MKLSLRQLSLTLALLTLITLIPLSAGAVTYYEVNNKDDDPEVHTFLFLRETPVYYPGYTSNIIDHYAPGTCVQFLRTSPKGGWYYVRTPDGKEGYMYHTYLKKVKTKTVSGQKAYVREDAGKYYGKDNQSFKAGHYATVYSEASNRSQVLASFLGGTQVTVLEKNDKWTKVYSSGVIGYMRTGDIDF